LVLEPTIRSRLQGDYKSGKRLNLRKIIPFIASNYKRDKIWLRRTKPTNRDFYVSICVDASRSMRDGGADGQAVAAAGALAEALKRVEAGSVRMVRFGDRVGDMDFDEMEFADESSDFCALLEYLLIDNSRQQSQNTLAIILSDGICHNHDKLRALVNQCLSTHLLPLLVVIDPAARITDLTTVKCEAGGVVFERYLATLPFEHYVVVQDLEQLPRLLSDALQQWFQASHHH
jgi:midasin